MKRILIAGFGNVLRGDDGFGPAVIQRLLAAQLPANVETLEAGAAGMNLVTRLMDSFDELIVVDAVRRGGEPGAIYEFEPSASDLDPRPSERLDPHTADPAPAMRLAAQLGLLPAKVKIVGCEPLNFDLTLALSPLVRDAVERAVARIREIILPEGGRAKVSL